MKYAYGFYIINMSYVIYLIGQELGICVISNSLLVKSRSAKIFWMYNTISFVTLRKFDDLSVCDLSEKRSNIM